jgi:hypothetical protein
MGQLNFINEIDKFVSKTNPSILLQLPICYL